MYVVTGGRSFQKRFRSLYWASFICALTANIHIRFLVTVYRVRSPKDMFSFLTSDLRPNRPQLDTLAFEIAIATAESAGVTK